MLYKLRLAIVSWNFIVGIARPFVWTKQRHITAAINTALHDVV